MKHKDTYLLRSLIVPCYFVYEINVLCTGAEKTENVVNFDCSNELEKIGRTTGSPL
jgi:hypothetical protein